MKKRIFARALALFMALSLLSTTAFAASFTDLQNAIDGALGDNPTDQSVTDTSMLQSAADLASKTPENGYADGTAFLADTGDTHYGYAWNNDSNWFGIEAWNGTRTETTYDENGNVTDTQDEVDTRYVQLNEDVNYGEVADGETDRNGLTIGNGIYAGVYDTDKHASDVSLDLNGHDIDFNPNAVLNVDDGKFYAAQKNDDGNKVATETMIEDESTLNHGAVISVNKNAHLTINNSSKDKNGSITGGLNKQNGGGIYNNNGYVTLNAGAITGNRAGTGGGIAGGTVVMNGGSISGNHSSAKAGGISTTDLLMNGGEISGNTAGQSGGGVHVNTGKFIMKNGKISNNRTQSGGGGVTVNVGKFVMAGGSITGNSANTYGGSGVWVSGSDFKMRGGSISGDIFVSTLWNAFSQMTHSNGTVSGDIVFRGESGSGTEKLTIGEGADALTYSFSYTSTENNEQQAVTIAVLDADGKQVGESGTTVLMANNDAKFSVNMTSGNLRIELAETALNTDITKTFGFGGYVDNTGFHPYETDPTVTEDPDDPTNGGTIPGTGELGDVTFTGSTADTDTTTITDDEIPLAGLLTLADLLEELRVYEEIPELDIPEDFQWIDHEYAQAIYWGLQEELVVDTEEDPLDPDELLTVGLMREVLANFVEIYKGLDGFEVILEGEDEDLVMDYIDMISRLAPFYEELEAALENLAA